MFYVGEQTVRELLQPPKWQTLLSARVPGNGVVELRERWRGSRLHCEYSMRWQTPAGQIFDYSIQYFSDRFMTHPELRATDDYSRVWLVARNRVEKRRKSDPDYGKNEPPVWGLCEIMAALDIATGRFMCADGCLVDPSLSFYKQLYNCERPEGDWDWATFDGGIVLVERHFSASSGCGQCAEDVDEGVSVEE